METFANQGLTFTDRAIIVKYHRWELWKFFEMVTNGTSVILTKGGSGRRSQTKNRQNDGGATRCHFKGANTKNYRLSQLFSLVWKRPNSPLLSSNLPDRKQFEARKNLRMFQLPEPFFTSVFPWFSLKFSIDLPFWKPVASLDKMLSNRSNKWIIRCP